MYEWRRRSRARRNSEHKTLRDRGAAAIEFALIAPFFFLIVFGGIEIGLMARSSLSLEDISRRAVRVASVQRDAATADHAILKTVQDRVQLLNGELLRVVIFRADSLATEFDTLPAGCQATDPPTTTNHDPICTAYTAAEVAAIAADPTGAGIDTDGFIAAERVSSGEVINIGVRIEYEYQFVTGFFDTTMLSSTSIEVVETSLAGG